MLVIGEEKMIKELNGHKPVIAKNAFIAEDAVLIGDVEIQEGASIWYGCILRGDSGKITVGKNSNVQDGCILHCDRGYEVNIGDNVTIGHGAIVHGAIVEDEVLIGMRATILNGAYIETQSMIAAGALVTEGKRIPSGTLAMGIPCKLKELSDDQRKMIKWNAEHYVGLADKYSKKSDL